MILLNEAISRYGATQNDALVWVGECTINSDRVSMNFHAQFSLKSLEPNYTPYFSTYYVNVPYDSALDLSAASQAYNYLMSLPEYIGGVQYP
jgi:hypothetical protein